MDCSRCLDSLDLARDFRQALRDGVAEKMVRSSLAAGLAAWFGRPRRTWILGLCGTLAALSTVWVVGGRFSPSGVLDELQPQVNIPTFTLGMTRSNTSPGVESPASDWLALEMEVGDLAGSDEHAQFAGYRVTLRTTNDVVWQQDVEPDRLGFIKLTLPPGSLKAGDYRLELEGLESGGRAVMLEAHQLRIVD